MNSYVALCRNYYYSELTPYFAIYCQAASRKDFIAFCLRNGFEPLKVIRLKSNKELKLFSTYSPINILNPIQ